MVRFYCSACVVLSVQCIYSRTCSCLMVSPPFPITRPTLFAGIRICWMELFPSISLWKPGPYLHCSIISHRSLFACLKGWSQEQDKGFVTTTCTTTPKENALQLWKMSSGDSFTDQHFKWKETGVQALNDKRAHFPNDMWSSSWSVKVNVRLTLCSLDCQSACRVCPACLHCLQENRQLKKLITKK